MAIIRGLVAVAEVLRRKEEEELYMLSAGAQRRV